MRPRVLTRDLARQAGVLLEMIKFQHTVFALPFALTGAVLAAAGIPRWSVVGWIVGACVCARTAAMCFNRLVDASLDARNPRTASRAIPAGQVGRGFTAAVTLASSALFVVCAWMLNGLTLALSPVALAVVLGYSLTKRFTAASHFVLGLALALAPVGAWVAVRGSLEAAPLLLGLAVLLWTAGFDLIYACQDAEFDRGEGLHSVPSRHGVETALRLSSVLHVMTVLALWGCGWLLGLGVAYYAGVLAVALLLVAEHMLVNPRDLSRIDVAFFTVNSWVGVAIFVFTFVDVVVIR